MRGPAFQRSKPRRKRARRCSRSRGHSVADLFLELKKRHGVPEDLIDRALGLDKAYIPTRHPNAHPTGFPKARYTKTEARG